ncbi:UTP11 domain containing protein [Nitzschia inconspicua]|uniref:U3 small nucleolar RNA-associated protein 11 n=1 Tax=Nitzschia inconspicua TaxID=303405 RepID=A0A9K3KC91_9STRA|nr:UTP11 domain containing protein [Nitzschia inconspicua]
MSSLRNAVKRITHKERSQPQDRQHLGILEKKKDYQKRARDYHAKQDQLQRLQQRASFRNPDEFYFGMQTSKVNKDGKHVSNDDYRQLDPQLVRVMKDQDLKFIRMQQQQDQKKAAKLQASLHLLESSNDGGKQSSKHTIFVDTVQEAKDFSVADHFDTVPELAHRSFNRLRKSDIEKLAANTITTNTKKNNNKHQVTSSSSAAALKEERKNARKLAKARQQAYAELQARQERAKALHLAEQHLVTEKLVASKGRKRKIAAAQDGQPAQYKWRRRRMK